MKAEAAATPMAVALRSLHLDTSPYASLPLAHTEFDLARESPMRRP